MVSWFKKLLGGDKRAKFLKAQESSKTPWACFEIMGFDSESKIKVEFHWNEAFITELDKIGFTAETPEDTVQLFFYASQMKPSELSGGDATVQSDSHPGLSQNTNKMVQ